MGFITIAALTQNWGIGFDNKLPWKRFKTDMDFFKEITLNTTVIMGRKTYESINSSLKGRTTVVVSSKTISFEQALKENCVIIGGSSIYEQAINHPDCEKIFLTHTNFKLENATSYFPQLNDSFYIKRIVKTGVETILTHQSTEVEIHYEIIEYWKYPRYAVNTIQSYQPIGEKSYLQAVNDIIKYGQLRPDRTGVGTRSLFGLSFRYDLTKGFPLLTTKKMFTKGIVEELLWFLRGDTDIRKLQAKNVKIWDGNSSREYLDSIGLYNRKVGDGGPIYGFQFRHFGAKYIDCETDYSNQGVDQVANVIKLIKTDPYSRRMIISLWNPVDIDKMVLPPCHILYQFWVSEGLLNCSLTQRSGDMGLGVPFNIASAALLTHIIASLTDLHAGILVHNVGDAHVYLNHIDGLTEQLKRTPRPFPFLEIVNRKTIEDFVSEDFIIRGYEYYPAIKMTMAV